MKRVKQKNDEQLSPEIIKIREIHQKRWRRLWRETVRWISLKFATFTPERWYLKPLRGYLILVRYAVVIVIWILASLFLEHSVDRRWDQSFTLSVRFPDFRFVASFWNYTASKSKFKPNFKNRERDEQSVLARTKGSHRCFRSSVQCDTVTVTVSHWTLDLKHYSILKPQRGECDWYRNSRPHFTLLDPVQFRGGVGKCLSEFYGLRSNLWYTFDRASLARMED